MSSPAEPARPDPQTAQAQISVHSTSDSRFGIRERFYRTCRPSRPTPRSAAEPALTAYAKHYQHAPSTEPIATDETERLKGAAESVAKNMDNSLTVPTATSFRNIPVKIMFDNRALINDYLKGTRGGKVSFTHLIGYRLRVESLVEMPAMNNSYTLADGKP